MAWNDIIHQTSAIRHLDAHHPYNIKHIYDCEELVKILVSRCKKLDQQINEGK